MFNKLSLFKSIFSLASAAVLAGSAFATITSGTWTPLANQCPIGVGSALLLTDGRVMVHDDSSTEKWEILTPDANGSYINGTWSAAGSMPTGDGPLYFASDVLTDGRVVVMGGEYNLGASADTNLCAVYNPVTNTWAAFSGPTGWTHIGDSMSVVLSNGKVLMADQFGSDMALLDPTTLTWTEETGSGKADPNGEEGWTVLPSGLILTVDCENGTAAETLDPNTMTWSGAGSTINVLPSNTGNPGIVPEMGPGVLRPDGSVFEIGASGFNSVYSSGGVWSVAPSFPLDSSSNQLDVADGPACVLPDGNVLTVASPTLFNTPLHCYEFDGTNLTEVANEPLHSIDSSFYCRLLTLPNGQVLFTDEQTQAYIYTPAGTYNSSWQPTISSCSTTLVVGSTSNAISGTQFNGLTQCNYYGDDNQQATNFPLVRIVNTGSGHVFYCKTHGHSTMAVATGGTTVSTNFDIPSGIETGASTLYVVANGIPSAAYSVTVQPTVSTLGLSPNVIAAGGQNSTGTVTLQSNAVGDETVTLQSSSADAQVPPSVTVTSGTNNNTFTVTASGVSSTETVTITATYGGTSQTANLTLNPASLASVKASPTSIQGGLKTTGEVTLLGKAQTGGTTVTLVSNSLNVQVPLSVSVPGQTDYFYFTVSTSSVTASETDTISATLNGVTKQVSVTVNPPLLTNLKTTSSAVVGGQSVFGVVDLNAKASGAGVPVSLSSASADVQVQPTAIVPNGSSYQYFPITTSVVSAQESVTLTGSIGSQQQTTSLTVNPAPVAQVKFTSSSIKGGTATMGEVVLNGKAGSGGDVVSLQSDSASATVPSTVTVPAGQNYVYFRITTSAVGSTTSVHITASLTPTSQQGTLTLNP